MGKYNVCNILHGNVWVDQASHKLFTFVWDE